MATWLIITTWGWWMKILPNVLNAQSTKTGFVRSKITENWDAVGYGKQIDYNGEDTGVVEPPWLLQ